MIYKNFMKAISRLLMILVLGISFTGFSFTTADLGQNSETETTICDCTDSASVIVVSVDSETPLEIIFYRDNAASSFKSFDLFFANEKKEIITDVRWHFASIGSDFKTQKHQSNLSRFNGNVNRNPRDGLTQS